MQMILLVVVRAINQSKYVPMMSLAVVGTLTNQIFGIYMGLRRCTRVNVEVYLGLCRSMWRSTWVYVGMGNIIQSKYVPMMSLAVVGTLTNQILWVYAGLCGSMWRSMRVYMGLCRGLSGAGEHYPIKICANDVIGCGGDINQSDFVGPMQVYAGLCGGLCGSTGVYAEVYVGLGNIIQSKYVPMMSLVVVGTLTNQILWVYAEVYMGLHGGLRRPTWGWGTLSNQNMCQ